MVSWADWHSGTYNNYGSSRICQPKGFLFALKLAQTIRADHILIFQTQLFHGLTIRLGTGEDAFRTGVQDSFGPGAKCFVEDVACALIIHRIEIASNACP